MEINRTREILYEYCDLMGIKNPDPKKITTPHFRAIYAHALNLAKANILPYESCVLATTTSDVDSIFNPNESGLPAVREVLGWVACRMLASGNFRIATPEENDRYFAEMREQEMECRKIEESRPERAQVAATREEAAHMRELVSTLIGAAKNAASPASASTNTVSTDAERRGPGRKVAEKETN
jgi:hypothetical protein